MPKHKMILMKCLFKNIIQVKHQTNKSTYIILKGSIALMKIKIITKYFIKKKKKSEV